MRVVIALASNSSQISGVQRHGLNLASCLLSRREITEVHLVAAPWQQQLLKDVQCSSYSRLHLHAAHIGHSAISRNLWFYAGLPSLARSLDADIVHLAYPAPLHRRAFACPVVVTLHDLYPYDIPENFGFPKVLFNRAVLRQCLSQADAIACVSTSTLGRLRKLDERLALTKAHVVYNSIRPRRFLANESRASGIPSLDPTHPFLLCVAQHRRNKNILLVLRAMKLLWHRGQLPLYTRLLIVGIAGPETRAIESFIAAHDLARHVILTNGIPEEQLQWCYRQCSALVAPSIVEGFGLPVAEALLAGCPIVCSDIPAFREVAGQSSHFVLLGPGEEERLVAAILTAMHRPRPEPLNLPQFAADTIAAQSVDMYQSLCRGSANAHTRRRHPLKPAKKRQVRL